MAYNPTEWKNREVEKPRTFFVQTNTDGSVTLTPSEGQITEPGTPIMADNMNKIEQALVKSINHVEGDTGHVFYADDTGTANAKVTAIPIVTTYKKGLGIAFENKTQNTAAVTINVNNMGAKAILKANGQQLASGALKAGSIYTVRYNGTSFILQGEGGEYGTATASDVLTGKTLGTENGVVNGTMPTKAAATITPGTTNQTIAAGQYLAGAQTIIGDADLISANILAGANIFGVQGTVQPKLYFNTSRSGNDGSVTISWGFPYKVLIVTNTYGSAAIYISSRSGNYYGGGDYMPSMTTLQPTSFTAYLYTNGGAYTFEIYG